MSNPCAIGRGRGTKSDFMKVFERLKEVSWKGHVILPLS
jgi:hypothetical protein